jgi:cobalt transporter subunit CbtA
MAALQRLLSAALCAGLLSGAFVAVAHQITTVPLIRRAELYENAARPLPAQVPAAHAEVAAWQPENGVARAAYTTAADLLAAIGFALLLAACLGLRGGDGGWREGLLWGLGGFAVFALAPGLGLPPEIPGAAAAPLGERQLWWLATAAATAAGLPLLVLTKRAPLAALGAALVVLPHLYGAPQAAGGTAGSASVATPALAHRFAAIVLSVNFLFWLALGASTGYFWRRFGLRPR